MRTSLILQRWLSRASGTALSFGLGGYLVWWARESPGLLFDMLAATLLLGSLALRARRRLGRVPPNPGCLLDVELFTQLVVLAYAVILRAPGGLEGPVQPVIYLLMMLVAGFTRPAAALATAAFAVLLEAALSLWALGYTEVERLAPHAILISVFAFINLAVFRAEIARVRRLSRSLVENELQRIKETARSYRLLIAPGSATESKTDRPNKDDEERLLQSGVEEIHEALGFALDLLRRSLKLKTAALLWLDSSGKELHIQEISSEEDGILPGPWSSRDGMIGAALGRGEPISLVGPKAGRHVPFYALRPPVGSVSAVPVVEHGRPRGVLLVDREEREPFSVQEGELLVAATHFALRAIENERVFIQLERAKIEQGKLYRVANLLAAATTEAQVIEAGVSGAREFAAFDFAVVTLFDRQNGEHEIRAASGDFAEDLVGKRFPLNRGLVSMVVANRHALPYRGDYDPARQMVFAPAIAPPPVPSLLVLPLLVHERALGTLILGSRRRGAFGDAVRTTLEVLASHVAVSLSNARMLRRLEELATTDGLTGLLNKRALLEAAAQKLRSATRFSKPLALLVCDIDHFKRVNDTYGHDVGDLVIRGLSDVLRRVKRDTDIVGRFGGEEFVVVCEETDARGAALLAERIRSEFAAASFPTELGSMGVTCSVGVAPYPAAGQQWETLFRATDEALYASKRAGRNRVTVWSSKLHGHAA